MKRETSRVKGPETMSEKMLKELRYLAWQMDGLGPVLAVLKYWESCRLAEIGHIL